MRRGLALMLCLAFGLAVLTLLVGCGDLRAIYTCSIAEGFAPLEVFFDGSASASGGFGAIEQYLWDFGDGATASGKTISHTFAEPGAYQVTLTIITSMGESASSGMGSKKTIVVLTQPEASFSAEPSDGYLEMQFDGSASTPQSPPGLFNWMLSGLAQKIIEYRWDFGDGTTETKDALPGLFGPPPGSATHAYTEPGEYAVTLTVTCNYGYSAQFTQTVLVESEDPPPSPDLTGSFLTSDVAWEITDDEEEPGQECIDVWGTVQNLGTVPAGCELTIVARDLQWDSVGTDVVWPANDTNIAVGSSAPFWGLICSLSVPAGQVSSVQVYVTDTKIWP